MSTFLYFLNKLSKIYYLIHIGKAPRLVLLLDKLSEWLTIQTRIHSALGWIPNDQRQKGEHVEDGDAQGVDTTRVEKARAKLLLNSCVVYYSLDFNVHSECSEN